MRYRVLGRTGLRVSEVGIGGAQFGIADYMGRWDPFTEAAQEATTATIRRALDVGYNYFDTAPGYGDGRSEEMVGCALKGRRHEAIVATKISRGNWSPAGIRASVEASLRRLRVDVLDVIQFHGGWYGAEDAEAVMEQGGLETLLELRDEGKARFIGFTAEGPSCGVERLIASGQFDVMQVRYNLMNQHPSDFVNNTGIIRQADAQGMGIVLMRPLTSGTFQKLMQLAFPGIDVMAVGRLLLNYVLSDPFVDVALTGVRDSCFVEINNRISDDVGSRMDLVALHDRFER